MSITIQPAAQATLLTEVLCHCIDRGRAAAQLTEPRRHLVIEQLVRQFYLSDGSLDLNGVWALLLREPGVTERALASAFAAMESLQPVLQSTIRPTQRLQILTAAQRQALLAECAVDHAEVERLAKGARPGPATSPSLALGLRPNLTAALSAVPTPAAFPTATAPMPAAAPTPAAYPTPTAPLPKASPMPAALRAPSGPPRPASGPPTASTPAVFDPTDPDRDARVRAARALVEEANAAMKADSRPRSQPNVSSPGVRRSRPGVTPPPSTPARYDRGSKSSKPGPREQEKRRAILIGAASFLIAAVIAGSMVWSNMPHKVDLRAVSAIELAQGRRVQEGILATIVDTRWSTLKVDAQRTAAIEAFRQTRDLYPIHTLSLINRDGTMEAQISDDAPNATPTTPAIMLASAIRAATVVPAESTRAGGSDGSARQPPPPPGGVVPGGLVPGPSP